ncbi:hypothetical protein [Tepidicaulis sp.]|uniref:hypothetical protein n=1 Tax=Tepidicaulis sp. TaxID=1920809 RepID=UPI003B593DD0
MDLLSCSYKEGSLGERPGDLTLRHFVTSQVSLEPSLKEQGPALLGQGLAGRLVLVGVRY